MTRRQPSRISKMNAKRAFLDMAASDCPAFLYPKRRNTNKRKVTIRLPAQVWNAYIPSPLLPSSPTRCTFRPGRRSFRYGKHSITYEQPCLKTTCPNCRKWYPKLIADSALKNPGQGSVGTITDFKPLHDTSQDKGSGNNELENLELHATQKNRQPGLTSQHEHDVPMVVVTEPNMLEQTHGPKPPARYRVRLRFRSFGSKAHYEKLVLAQRLQHEDVGVPRQRGILKRSSSRIGTVGVGKKVRFGKMVRMVFGSEMGRRKFAALLRERSYQQKVYPEGL